MNDKGFNMGIFPVLEITGKGVIHSKLSSRDLLEKLKSEQSIP